MTDEQRSALNLRLPLWAGRQDAEWQSKLDKAVEYYELTGLLPRKKHGEYANVSTWLRSQRSLHRKGEVNPERVKMLDEKLPGWIDEI